MKMKSLRDAIGQADPAVVLENLYCIDQTWDALVDLLRGGVGGLADPRLDPVIQRVIAETLEMCREALRLTATKGAQWYWDDNAGVNHIIDAVLEGKYDPSPDNVVTLIRDDE